MTIDGKHLDVYNVPAIVLSISYLDFIWSYEKSTIIIFV